MIYNGIEYTILLEEEDRYHLVDNEGNGICILKTEL